MNTASKVCASLGAYPGRGILRAMELAQSATEPLWGSLSMAHVQLCPQNMGRITDAVVDELKVLYPNTVFRLHANARVLDKHLPMASLSSWRQNKPYFEELARVSKLLGADAYTLHAGYRRDCSLAELFGFTKEAEDMFGIPVGIEGLYPDAHNTYLVSTWEEHDALYQSGVRYAIDLSHLNILCSHTNETRHNLIRDMLSSERCLEVHVSGNDGSKDSHKKLSQEPWWMSHLECAHPSAVVFTEGNQVR